MGKFSFPFRVYGHRAFKPLVNVFIPLVVNNKERHGWSHYDLLIKSPTKVVFEVFERAPSFGIDAERFIRFYDITATVDRKVLEPFILEEIRDLARVLMEQEEIARRQSIQDRHRTELLAAYREDFPA